ncbi:hypothetical protein ACFYO2_26715 [Streptomyces sp. NPDC006602]|uniref:hypothetical protein n=1 Tax=Streptomyces sp. NPDC006602 TaxID=3364751 RepID=UPI0036A63AE4
MRRPILPSDTELLKKEEAGLTHREIGIEFGVSRQAVTKRFNAMGKYVRAAYRDATALLPWDLTNHPAKDALRKDESFWGLRAFVRQQMGGEVSKRSELALRTFENHIKAGQVLDLDPVQGVRWVRREPERDGSLVIRWPDDVPQDERTALFRYSPAQSGATAE